MSRATVYRITLDGTVDDGADVSNGSAGAPVIWDALCAKHLGVATWMNFSKGPEPLDELHKKLNAGELPEDDAVLLLFTYDRTWVLRENIPLLVGALERFWAWNGFRVDRSKFPSEVNKITPTIPGIIAELKKLEHREDTLGACFQMTSVSANVWRVRDPEIEDESRPFNVLVDLFGKDKPEELKEELTSLYAKKAPAAQAAGAP